MSFDVQGGTRVALVKRHYDADDSVSIVIGGVTYLNGIPFTATPTYYVSGLMAAATDPTVLDVMKGWCLFTHGQPAAPVWLAPFLAGLGITTWPTQVPAFEAKDILFLADQDCWVQFHSNARVRHFIPQNDYRRFHTRCFMFFVSRAGDDNGTLRVWIEG